ncbi:hypothetical protein F4810DRAFT_11746 [Camillea tinctor]|nr:hypothetical protein F4810DRAFT_11746 [Camillea tinctor]
MIPLRHVLAALLFFTTFAAAQNISSYIPACAPPCIEDTVKNTTVCNGLDENTCLCSRMEDVGRQSFRCFFTNCGSIPDARNQVMTGWQNFCSVVQGTANGTTISPTASSTPSAPTSASTAPGTTSTPAASSVLSTGAKAGIGISAGISGLSIIGGLIFLGFRLGRRKRGATLNTAEDQESSGANNGNNGDNDDKSAADALGYKPQLDGNAVSELQPDYGPDDPNPVKELEARERPAELWHGESANIASPTATVSKLDSSPNKDLAPWTDNYCYDPDPSGTYGPIVYELPTHPSMESSTMGHIDGRE